MRVSALVVAGLMVAFASHAQQSGGAAEVAFWQSVSGTGNAAEIQAYLDAYPQGQFALRARQLLQGLRPSSPAQPQRMATPEQARARLRLVQNAVRLTDGVTLDIDAEALRRGSNLRLAVVPAGTPDTVADPDTLVAESTPVHAARLHLTIPSGPPGQDEVRLYYIPPFQAEYVVAGRAAVVVGPGVPGATLTRDLTREAAQIGPVRFEANHRDRLMLVQAAFLRVRPRTEWNPLWFDGVPGGELPRQFVVMSIGQPNVTPDVYGSTGEAICALSATDSAMLNRIASLRVGDPVTVVGVPTSWDSASPADPVLLDRCALR